MKGWRAATLFRRLAAFARGASLAGAMVAATATSAGATDYTAALGGCRPIVPPSIFNSPVPVSLIGGDEFSGGGVHAGSPLTAEVHTGARAPNVPANDVNDCGASARAAFTDVVIQGPAPRATVRLHVPFHANIIQNFAEFTDGSNAVFSGANANLFFNVQVGGARVSVELRWNRQAHTADVLVQPAVFPFGSSEVVARPRVPGLTPLDPDGIVTQFFQRSTPVQVQNGALFVGFDTYAIDEVRGEILLTTEVATNQPISVFLAADARSTAVANFVASAFGVVSEVSLGVPTDGGIVFDLPEGFTAQSPSAGVIDNVVPQVFKCPKTVADWRSHPADWPLSNMTLGGQIYTPGELLTLLQTTVSALRPDASVSLAQQLIAARLNEANGAAPGPMLQPSMVADSLFATFGGKLPYRVLPQTAIGQQMMNIAIALNNYNAGRLGLQCVP